MRRLALLAFLCAVVGGACGGSVADGAVRLPLRVACFADGDAGPLVRADGQLVRLSGASMTTEGPAPACPFTSSGRELFAGGQSVAAPVAPVVNTHGWAVDPLYLYHVRVEYLSPNYELWLYRGPRSGTAQTKWVRLNEHVDPASAERAAEQVVLSTESYLLVGLNWVYVVPKAGGSPVRHALPGRVESMAALDVDTFVWTSQQAHDGSRGGVFRTSLGTGSTVRIAEGPATRVRVNDGLVYFLRDVRSLVAVQPSGAAERVLATSSGEDPIIDYLPAGAWLYWASGVTLTVVPR